MKLAVATNRTLAATVGGAPLGRVASVPSPVPLGLSVGLSVGVSVRVSGVGAILRKRERATCIHHNIELERFVDCLDHGKKQQNKTKFTRNDY